jgi:hypothetical protein
VDVADPVPEMIIPVTQGAKSTQLRVRTRAECRALIASAALAAAQLPDDGADTVTLIASLAPGPRLAAAGPGSAIHSAPGHSLPSGRAVILESVAAAPDMATLRAMLMDAWEYCPDAVFHAITGLDNRPCLSRRKGEPCTVRGTHQVHYGAADPDDSPGICAMWHDSEADADVPRPLADGMAPLLCRTRHLGPHGWYKCGLPVGHEAALDCPGRPHARDAGQAPAAIEQS